MAGSGAIGEPVPWDGSADEDVLSAGPLDMLNSGQCTRVLKALDSLLDRYRFAGYASQNLNMRLMREVCAVRHGTIAR